MTSPNDQTTSYAPTDIEATMHIKSINLPDLTWFMDTDATCHLTSSNGNNSSYFYLSNHHNGILVGNGHTIPICGYGHTSLPTPNPPLSLKDVLHAPEIIENLISVRVCTTDNCVTVEFDPFGFSVKDLQIGRRIMRRESRGDLYPLTNSSNNQALPSTFSAISSSLWHDRLGHLGGQILDTFRQNKIIDCNRISTSTIYHSCVLGKHVKLPFFLLI